MRLDFGTLAFGYNIKAGGGTPNWATSLGQGKDYKINSDSDIDEILRGMTYCLVPLAKISTKIGKGGNQVKGDAEDSPISAAAVFSNVYINDTLINDGKFILLITKDTSQTHKGRLRFKYGPSNTYEDNGEIFSNLGFFQKAKKQLSLANDACWFVTDISSPNQNDLRLTAVIVDPSGPVEYETSAELHKEWETLAPSNFISKITFDTKIGENLILYGVPGCGKSHYIKDNYCNDENFMERVVFHPDYTYSDFVGQIMPQCTDCGDGQKHISYEFTPGPFTRILKQAIIDKSNNYYLIIEEINRGNAPAIFGDIFQLLDRCDGESEYGINNADIAFEIYKDTNHPIKIPANLFILATMNTADQNVFTLDTAFKRRWIMKSIPNDITKCKFANDKICNTNVTWATFVEKINHIIIELNENSISNEDKRLGAYFVQPKELSNIDLFAEKVLMYLWNDAFKYGHDRVFKSNYKTLEQLIDGFKNNNFEIFLDSINFEKAEVTNA